MHAAADSVCVLRQVHKQTLLCKLFPECCMCTDTTGMIPAYVYGHMCIYGQAYCVQPPPQWCGLVGVGGGWRVSGRLGGVLLGGGQGSQRGPGSYASPTQAINPIT